MEAIQYAIALETHIKKIISVISEGSGQEMILLADVLTNHQVKTIELLKFMQTRLGNFDAQAEVSALFDDPKLHEAIRGISGQGEGGSVVSQSCILWTLYALYDRTFQYYRQASHNTPQPTDKYFYSSLAEVKNIVRRRIDAASRVLSNEVWGQVGFAPFIIGKE